MSVYSLGQTEVKVKIEPQVRDCWSVRAFANFTPKCIRLNNRVAQQTRCEDIEGRTICEIFNHILLARIEGPF